jgi:hypothetical protein
MITYSHLVPPLLRNNKLVLLIRKETHIFFIYMKRKKTILNSYVLYLLITKFVAVVVLRSQKMLKYHFIPEFTYNEIHCSCQL